MANEWTGKEPEAGEERKGSRREGMQERKRKKDEEED